MLQPRSFRTCIQKSSQEHKARGVTSKGISVFLKAPWNSMQDSSCTSFSAPPLHRLVHRCTRISRGRYRSVGVEGLMPHKKDAVLLPEGLTLFVTHRPIRILHLMSQETLVSQTTPSHSLDIIATCFLGRPQMGYEALPCEDSEDESDVELCAFKWTSESDVEASPITTYLHPSLAAGSRTTVPHPSIGERRSPSWSTWIPTFGVLKISAILLIAGLPSTLGSSFFACIFGAHLLNVLHALEVPTYASVDDIGAAVQTSIAGAPLVALAVGALAVLDFVLRRLPRLQSRRGPGRDIDRDGVYDQASDILILSYICVPASVFAMPLGLLMMPHLGSKTFGVWSALGWSAMGLGVPLVAVSFPLLLLWLWCTTVRL